MNMALLTALIWSAIRARGARVTHTPQPWPPADDRGGVARLGAEFSWSLFDWAACVPDLRQQRYERGGGHWEHDGDRWRWVSYGGLFFDDESAARRSAGVMR